LLPPILTLVAAVALAAHAVLRVLCLWGRAAGVHVDVFAEQLEKLVRAGNSSRAVKLCCALDARSPVRQLALFMFGLELPAVERKSAATGYRGAPSVDRFGDVVPDLVGREAARLGRALRPHSLAVVGSGVIAAATACTAFLLGAEGAWRIATMCLGAGAAIGVVFGVTRARRLHVGLRLVRDRMLPHLRPVEEMTDDQREAAAAARERLRSPEPEAPSNVVKGSFPVNAVVVAGVAVLVAAVAVPAMLDSGDSGSSANLAGPSLVARVTRATGSAPVAEGATCSVMIFDNRDDGTFDCRVHVQCGPTSIYATESDLGYTNCVWDGATAVAAHDARWDDGDPAMQLDRRTGYVGVRDETWSVTLEVVPSTPGAGAQDAGVPGGGA